MTPAEVATKLRAFNEWRRGDEDIPQFDPREISEVIDAAVEMIERLEAAEKARDDVARQLVQSEQGKRKISEECDALRAESDARKALIDVLRAEIGGLRAKIEAAEKSDAESIAMYRKARDERDALRIELDEIRYGVAVAHDTIKALRAKIAEMERQEPVAKVRVHQTGGNAGLAWSVAPLNDFDALPLMRDGDRLYALPGAKGEEK